MAMRPFVYILRHAHYTVIPIHTHGEGTFPDL